MSDKYDRGDPVNGVDWLISYGVGCSVRIRAHSRAEAASEAYTRGIRGIFRAELAPWLQIQLRDYEDFTRGEN